MSKLVLVISYVFPPAAYVGVHRTLKYCKYLGEVGWRPIVITIDPRGVGVQDERLNDELPPEVEVFRTRDIDPAKWRASRSRRKPREEPAASTQATEAPLPRSARTTGALSRAKQFVLRALLQSPDSHIFWVPFAFFRGVRVLMTRRIDVIYSSSPPHSSHLAAWLLSKCFRVPHVADFRDPWFVEGSRRAVAASSGVFTGLQATLKRCVVANAAKIVSVSAGERNDLLAELPGLHPSRVEVITNGYDPDDFSDTPTPMPSDGRFTITHAGTLYPGVGREFFDAIEQLASTRHELSQRLRVNLLGTFAPEYQGVIDRLSRLGVVRDLGFQPHRTALGWTRNSDVLLILIGGSFFLPSHVPAKTFEYLSLGKPILAVAQPGDLTDILKESGLGVTVPPRDVPGLATAILNLYSGLRSGQLALQPNWAYISRFERRRLAHTLAGVLDQVAAGRQAKYAGQAAQGAR
ncbi:MAG: glycosyltransferase [Luteitalea sp.]|nr:glycosyltransferase [Luteitalea sp.]